MRDEYAVSPVIGTLLVLAIFTSVAATVILVGRPQLEDLQEKGQFQTVRNQMSAATADLHNLAVGGNPGEVRNPAIATGSGTLQYRSGHLVAVAIGYFNTTYELAADDSGVIDAAPNVTMQKDWTDPSNQIRFDLNGTSLAAMGIQARLWQWTGTDWYLRGTVPPVPTPMLVPGPLSVTVGLPTGTTLYDGPWWVEVRAKPALTPSFRAADVYIYEQSMVEYTMEGPRGGRALFMEGGGLFRWETGRYYEGIPSLIGAPDASLGNAVFTYRGVDLVAPDGGSASGHSKVSLLMSLGKQEWFVYSAGANVVRVQMEGPFPSVWYNHLVNQGFTAEGAAYRGVYFDQTTAGLNHAFPFHFVYTEIDMRVRHIG